MVIADGLAAGGTEVWALGTSASPLASLSGVARSAFGKAGGARAAARRAVHGARVAARATGPVCSSSTTSTPSRTPTLNGYWERILRSDLVRVVATIEMRNISGFSMDPLLNEVRKARRALYLQPDDPVELFQTIGVRPPIRPGTPMPPGPGRPRRRSPPDADPGRVAHPAGDGARPEQRV